MTDDGELIPVYEATSADGYGSHVCSYLPLDAIRKIIGECEREVDEFAIEIKGQANGKILVSKTATQTAASRLMSMRTMAENATINLVGMFAFRLRDALVDGVNDGLIIAKSSLSAIAAQYLERKGIIDEPADVRPFIKEAAKRAADKKRADLISHIEGLPNLLARRGRGARKKSKLTRKREREAYILKVTEAYRAIRIETGGRPTKVSVARRLTEGGVNRKSGIDSSSAAFGNKLKRLKGP